MSVLISWIGYSDLKAARGNKSVEETGPVLRLLLERRFDRIHLLNDLPVADSDDKKVSPDEWQRWLIKRAGIASDIVERTDFEKLENNYDRAYQVTCNRLKELRDRYSRQEHFTFFLSPGLPAAQVAMILAAQTLFEPERVELINTSKEHGNCIELVTLPYTLSVDAVAPVVARWMRHVDQESPTVFNEIKGSSDAIKAVKAQAARVARFDQVNVLLLGESGTGKEMFAQCIHDASPRQKHPFKPVNCAAIPSNLMESELFGHVKGAFTGADKPKQGLVGAAQGGTLFLDEIGDMPVELQPKLLRLLQEDTYTPVGSTDERKANVRVIAATHRDLGEAIRAGRFRGDLLYRLDQVSIVLPPLRERGRDVQELAQIALERFYTKNSIAKPNQKQLSPEALIALNRRPWVGNVRELENAISRLAIFTEGPEITSEDVSVWVSGRPWGEGKPLREDEDRGILHHLVAVIDEVLQRRREETWPRRLWPEGDSPFIELLQAMCLGRALRLENDNRSAAGRLLDTTVDTSRGRKEAERWEQYKVLYRQEKIEEEIIRRLREGGT